MTPRLIQRWIDIIESDPADGRIASWTICSPRTPCSFRRRSSPRRRVAPTAVSAGRLKLFAGTDFHYVGQWFGERSAVLEFVATIDGVYVNGVDMIDWNDAERIVSFKVMLRPFKGLQVIMPKMAELLQQG